MGGRIVRKSQTKGSIVSNSRSSAEQATGDLLACGAGTVAVGQTEVAAQQLEHRQARHRSAVRRAVRLVYRDPTGAAAFGIAPHCSQKAASGRFSVWHVGHFIAAEPTARKTQA